MDGIKSELRCSWDNTDKRYAFAQIWEMMSLVNILIGVHAVTDFGLTCGFAQGNWWLKRCCCWTHTDPSLRGSCFWFTVSE